VTHQPVRISVFDEILETKGGRGNNVCSFTIPHMNAVPPDHSEVSSVVT